MDVDTIELFLFLNKYNYDLSYLVSLNNGVYTYSEFLEIKLGIEKKLDVSKYFDLKFDFIKMREIKNILYLDILKDIDFKEYNYRQLRELRLGYMDNVDISTYKNPRINSEKMREIRFSLK